MSYYGCTATGHSEHTCSMAYYCGPKRFRKKEAWCDNCKATYKHPDDEKSE